MTDPSLHNQPLTVAALYKFAPMQDIEQLQTALQDICDTQGVCGTLLLAHEGINGTIAGSRAGIDAVLKYLRSVPSLSDLSHKESTATEQPFHRMKVRLKKEIVTIGMADVNPNETVGTYVTPKDWNKIISDPDTVVIDTRNGYEIGIGTFKGAVDPKTESFRAFPDYVRDNLDPTKNKKVAMFCTGGIRCEKASSLMKKLGFEEVYHLQGGILKYLEEVPPQESLWEGECFVFDQRVSVGHGLRQGDYILCPSCRLPVSAEARLDARYEEGVSCPHCSDSLTPEKRDSARERHKQMQLAAARGEKHIGAQYETASETQDETASETHSETTTED